MRRVLYLALFALVLTACGGNGSTADTTANAAASAESATDGDAGTTEAPPATEAATEDSTGAPSSDSSDEELTLDALFGGFSGADDPAEAEAFYAEQERLVQESIRDCMAAEGFDYIPFSYDQSVSFSDPFEELGEREFAETYGYGIATWVLEDPWSEPVDEGDIPIDPNQEIVEAMDEATVDEYYFVLYGDQPDIEEGMSDEEINALFESWEPNGCQDMAYDVIYGGEDLYTEFGEELDAMYEAIESDPRIVAISTEWSECMTAAGHSFSENGEQYEYLEEKLGTVVTYPNPGDDAFLDIVGEDGDSSDLTPEQEAALNDLYKPQFDEAELQALVDEEIAIAVADIDCRGDHDDLWQEVYEEYEAGFIDANRAALEAYRDANG